uniref:Galectin n=1 Tax=Panthera leo TaxID=9689 RepID=A0A8C8XQX6_PANLE
GSCQQVTRPPDRIPGMTGSSPLEGRPLILVTPFPCRFALNLGQGSSKVDLHFNPRFSESVIVCNSLDGTWGEEQKDGHMCFSPGSEVKFTVTFDNDGFKVKLSDGHQLTFPNRMGHSHLSYLSVQGGLSITSFKID